MRNGQVRSGRVERPLVVVVPTLLVGAVLVALILALSAFYLIAAMTLYSLLMGLSAGAFGGLWSHRLGLSPRPAAIVSGVFFGLLVGGLFWAFLYLLFTANAGSGVGFLDFARLLLWTSPLGNLVRIVTGTSDPVAVLLELVEVALVMWCAAFVAVRTHKNMERM